MRYDADDNSVFNIKQANSFINQLTAKQDNARCSSFTEITRQCLCKTEESYIHRCSFETNMK